MKRGKKTINNVFRYLPDRGDTMVMKVVSQGKASPLYSRCADPFDFPKRGKLDCIICGSGTLRSCSLLKNINVFLCDVMPFKIE